MRIKVLVIINNALMFLKKKHLKLKMLAG